jgi:hypothetical protein
VNNVIYLLFICVAGKMTEMAALELARL